MIIDGSTSKRSDGSVVCIGYGLDKDGIVVDRFAVPQGYDWDAPDAAESVEFVDSMTDLPAVHSDYKTQS